MKIKKFPQFTENKKIILSIFIFWIILVSLFTFFVKPSPMISTLVLYIPLCFLSFYLLRRRKVIKKILFVTLIFGLSISFLLNLIATYNGAWNVIDTLVPLRILGLFPLVDLIWYFLAILFSLLFYEYFSNYSREKISKNMFKILYPVWIFLVLSLVAFFVKPEFLKIPYAYLVLGVLFILTPLIYLAVKRPVLLKKLFLTSVFFGFLNLLFELSGRYAGQWFFPGQYLGWITVFGISFPFEELLFYIILSTPAVIAYYEIFFDDFK